MHPSRYPSEFGDDSGTWWPPSGPGAPIASLTTRDRSIKKELRKRVGGRPIVWVIDDEQTSRNWFVENHRKHWALVTFSSRNHLVEALESGVPCDIVVTDVFFAAQTPVTPDEERDLLRVYDEIEKTTIARLPELWTGVRKKWQLLGFTVAQDVVEWARRRKETLPVILYSRKAPLLLDDSEWLSNPEAVQNTYWMTEKINPDQTGDVVRKIVTIQRNRIDSLLSLKRKSAPWWMKVLSGIGVKIGPFQYSLAWLKDLA